MKVAEFKYTKANGITSERTVLVTQEPTKHLSGIDVTEMDDDMYFEYVNEVQSMITRHKEEMIALGTKFDLKHNFRQFIQENITDMSMDSLI